jgi:uncharacterized surface protein with fasciclin (FAS1) repeats
MRKTLGFILSFTLLLAVLPVFAQDTTQTPAPVLAATLSPTTAAAQAPAAATPAPTTAATASSAEATAESTSASAETTETPAQTNAFFRFANFAPGVTVTFSMDNQPVAGNPLDYKAFSDWAALTDTGKHTLTVQGTGGNTTQSQPVDVTLDPGKWTTIAVIGTSQGALNLVTIDQTFDKVLPGTAWITLVNAVQGSTNVDFIRNDSTYTANLFPLGNDQNQTSWFSLDDDVDTYHFKVVENGHPDNVLVDAPNTKLVENGMVLIAAVGTTDPNDQFNVEFLVNNTDMSTVALLTGQMQQPGTIIQAAAAHPELAAWLQAVQQAGLTDMLSGQGPFTVFADANLDLSKLPDALKNDPKALADFLSSQIVYGDLRSKDILKASGTLTTLKGDSLNLTLQGNNGFVNNAQVIAVDIPATNGIIHVVNDFVTPPPQS